MTGYQAKFPEDLDRISGKESVIKASPFSEWFVAAGSSLLILYAFSCFLFSADVLRHNSALGHIGLILGGAIALVGALMGFLGFLSLRWALKEIKSPLAVSVQGDEVGIYHRGRFDRVVARRDIKRVDTVWKDGLSLLFALALGITGMAGVFEYRATNIFCGIAFFGLAAPLFFRRRSYAIFRLPPRDGTLRSRFFPRALFVPRAQTALLTGN